MKYFVNGELIHHDQATIQINDLGLIRGYAAFDYLRVIHNIPLFIDDHLDRFFHSMNLMKLNSAYSKAEVKEFVQQLIRKNQLGISGLRLIVSGGFSSSNYLPSENTNFFIFHDQLTFPSEEVYNKGIAVKSVDFQRPLPQVKSTNYFMGILQSLEMGNQFQDVLYHNNGKVTELPRANVFMVTNKKEIITPKSNILHGITRKNLLQLKNDGFVIKEKDFTLSELKANSSEVFLSSSTKRVLPITRIDDQKIGDGKPGEISKLLKIMLLQKEADFIEEYSYS